MQAVLIEHDEIVLSDLSAVVVSEGQKGENLIKDYDQVTVVQCSKQILCDGSRTCLQLPVCKLTSPA